MKADVAFASKLSFDRRLVDHRPDLTDLPAPELIEDVLDEVDPPAVHREIEEVWSVIDNAAIEAQL